MMKYFIWDKKNKFYEFKVRFQTNIRIPIKIEDDKYVLHQTSTIHWNTMPVSSDNIREYTMETDSDEMIRLVGENTRFAAREIASRLEFTIQTLHSRAFTITDNVFIVYRFDVYRRDLERRENLIPQLSLVSIIT